MIPHDPFAREQLRAILAPLFTECHEVEFRGGTLFFGWASSYCEEHRREVEVGLRQLPGGFCFERLGGRLHLTCALPGPQAKPVRWLLHAGLLAATILTTLMAGAMWSFDNFFAELWASLVGAPESMSLLELGRTLLIEGGPFSFAIILILGTHESGHYLMARRYGMLVTPPFFLPAPLPPVGTFGAIIRMRSPMLHRRALLDIGLAGPLAGLAVSLPFLLYGITQCRFDRLPWAWTADGGLTFGNSLFTWLLSRFYIGVPANYTIDWLSHPFAWAGWIGLLVTALNLIPVGQLDGSHVTYALVGRRQRLVAFFFIGTLIALSQQWRGWLIWIVIMVAILRIAHPPVIIESLPLDRRRRILGWIAAVIFLLIFMPAPVRGVF